MTLSDWLQHLRNLLPNWSSAASLEDRRFLSVVVTGCDSGFGQLVARDLCVNGCSVFALCLGEERAVRDTLVSLLPGVSGNGVVDPVDAPAASGCGGSVGKEKGRETTGGRRQGEDLLHVIQADVSCEISVQKAVRRVSSILEDLYYATEPKSHFATGRLGEEMFEDDGRRDNTIENRGECQDVRKAKRKDGMIRPPGLFCLINNAGVFEFGGFELMSEEAWRRVFEVNVLGVARCARLFLPLLQPGGANTHLFDKLHESEREREEMGVEEERPPSVSSRGEAKGGDTEGRSLKVNDGSLQSKGEYPPHEGQTEGPGGRDSGGMQDAKLSRCKGSTNKDSVYEAYGSEYHTRLRKSLSFFLWLFACSPETVTRQLARSAVARSPPRVVVFRWQVDLWGFLILCAVPQFISDAFFAVLVAVGFPRPVSAS
uniref:Uncharacterized protein n=1 Tax=Chromera velia CCMP2878 TaxID=1169474 RepID=A0A0K6S685_9ALVE|eukprot:Cvel_16740.t1-p1 / transcript=Cvel_16740.t1 / gene=Cvel_16740 / organism=Chromera_velia_CCMP2878 / gene_product=hypothetical protein / transcript_product=hypothetical protein / location=Cvel_scaffold1302:40747-43610(-) / protein_length=428 / sequence_SO=supercontig / SO=protein_coding / is_pseudo=false